MKGCAAARDKVHVRQLSRNFCGTSGLFGCFNIPIHAT